MGDDRYSENSVYTYFANLGCERTPTIEIKSMLFYMKILVSMAGSPMAGSPTQPWVGDLVTYPWLVDKGDVTFVHETWTEK